MKPPPNIQAEIKGDNYGQIAIGTDIEQHQHQHHHHVTVGTLHGDIAVQVKELPEPRPREVLPKPKDLPRLLGRAAKLAETKRALAEGESVESYGELGVGRTALLRHLAHRLDDPAFPDGIAYANVAGQSFDDVVQTLFNLFYSTSTIPLKPALSSVQELLAGKKSLIFLDDVGLSREELLRLFIEVAPSCAFHVTTRHRKAAGETRGVKLEGLALDASLTLVERTLGRTLADDERAPAERLHQALNGNPLRLVQAVARVREESASTAALSEELDAKAADAATVQAAGKRSKEDRRLLAILALFRGKPVHARHLSALAGVTDVEVALQEIAREGLVAASASGERYGIAENLVASTETWDHELALDRALDYFVSWVERERRAPERIEREAHALIQLVERAAEAGRHRDVMRLAKPIEASLTLNGHWDARQQVLLRYLAAAEAAEDKASEGYAKHQLGALALCLGRDADAKAYLKAAYGIRYALGDHQGAAVSQYHLNLIPAGPPPPTEPTPPEPTTPPGTSPLVKAALVGVPVAAVVSGLMYWMFHTRAPTGVDFPPESVTAVSTDVQWNDTNDGRAPYAIEQLQGDGFVELARLDPTATTYSLADLAPNETYTYRVSAVNRSGELVPSGVAVLLTLPVAASDLVVRNVSDIDAELAWKYENGKVPDFRVERLRDGNYVALGTVTDEALSFIDSPLEPNTHYQYRVVSFNDRGDSADAVDVAMWTHPGTPAGFVVTTSVDSVTLDWKERSAAESFVERQRSDGTFQRIDELAAGVTRYVDEARSPNVLYVYHIGAHNEAGVINWSKDVPALTLPLAPSELRVVTQSDTSIELGWVNPHPNLPEYRIESRRPGESDYTAAGVVNDQGQRYTHLELDSNTEYVYRVRAFNASGPSDYSQTTRGLTLPATPSELKIPEVTADKATLTWQDQSDRPSQFDVERREGEGSFQVVARRVAETQYRATALQPNTYYTFQVRAVNNAGSSEGFSREITLTKPVAPENLTVRPASASSVFIRWDQSPNPSAVQVECRERGASNYAVAETVGSTEFEYQHQGLASNTEYECRVRGVNDSGDSEYTAAEAAYTNPETPVRLDTTTVTADSATLKWIDESAAPPAYEITQRLGGDVLRTERVTEPRYVATGLVSNTDYAFAVRAVNRDGASPFTEPKIVLTAPMTPEKLTPAPTSDTTVKLSWDYPHSRWPAVELEFQTRGGQPSTIQVPAGVRQYTHTGLASNTDYVYRVRAVNNTAPSELSPPSMVLTLPATPADLDAIVDGQSISLHWQDRSAHPTEFVVEQQTVGGGFDSIARVAVGGRQHLIMGLASNTTYTFRVRATNDSGDSDPSNVATRLTAPVTPTNLHVAAASETAVNVSWSYPDANWPDFELQLRRDDEPFGEARPAKPGPFGQLTPNTTYAFRVRGVNATDASPWSDSRSLTTLPASPKDLQATVGERSIDLSWQSANPAPIRYSIERAVESGGFVSAGTSEAASYRDTNIAPETSYRYRVSAMNGSRRSGHAETSALTRPGTPASLSAQAVSQTEIQLRWQYRMTNRVQFRIGRRQQGGSIVSVGDSRQTSFADRGLVPGTTYEYHVIASNRSGVSQPAVATATTPRLAQLHRVDVRTTTDYRGRGDVVYENQPAIAGLVTMDQPTSSEIVVTLSSSNPQALRVPPSVRVGPGQTVGSFTASTPLVDKETPVVVRASYAGRTREIRLLVVPGLR